MTPRGTAAAAFPLTASRPGQRVRVSSVGGGSGIRARLCAMGLAPGVPAEVVSVGSGPAILNVMGCRLMLGHGMAARVLVREA